MPTKVLETYAKEANVSIEKAEECWEKAKHKADKIYDKKDSKYWGFVNNDCRKCLGLDK